jgi:CPA1 family monovalent cation:H+ antiporter
MEFDVGLFVLLMTFLVGLGVIARRLTVPYPILFVLGGLFISFIPRLPSFTIDPDLVFFLFLPPLLYIQAFFTSWRDFRRQLRSILMLAIGLVIATTLVVAYVAHAVIPEFPLAAGLVLGAIISPPDAVAASAIAQNLALPRRLVSLLEGESLINDATGLVAFKMSLAAVGTTALARHVIWQPGMFTYIAVGGIVTGLVIGWGISYIRRLLIDAGPQIVLTISLLTPFVSYLVADVLDVSGVLSVVATGLFLGWQSPFVLTPAVRLEANAFWNTVIYLLNGIVFILIGLQLPAITAGIRGESWPRLFYYAFVVNAACILVRLAWVFPGAYLPRLIPSIRRAETCPDWRQVFIVGWSGMRGVVSLAAALTLVDSPRFPQAHLVQFLAFSVILTTLVLQGLTLPPLIRLLGVGDDGSARAEEREALQRMSAAVRKKLKELRGSESYPTEVVESVESSYRERELALQDNLAEQLGWSDRRHRTLALRKLRRAMVLAQRHTLVEMRRKGEIGDDVMHKIERQLDLEDARLKI